MKNEETIKPGASMFDGAKPTQTPWQKFVQENKPHETGAYPAMFYRDGAVFKRTKHEGREGFFEWLNQQEANAKQAGCTFMCYVSPLSPFRTQTKKL